MDKIDLFMRHDVPSDIHANKSVLVTISDGALEPHLFRELMAQGHKVKGLARNLKKAHRFGLAHSNIIEAVTSLPKTLKGKLEGVHTIISTIGMSTREKGLFDRVADYQSQINLLKEAQRAGVKKFIYLTPIVSDWDKNPKVIEGKTNFMSELRVSGIAYTIVYPNSIFFDSKGFIQGTHNRKISNLENARKLMDPSSPKDLAIACVDTIKIPFSETNGSRREILAVQNKRRIPAKVHSKKAGIIRHQNFLNGIIGHMLRKFRVLRASLPINPIPKVFKEDHSAIKYRNQPISRFARNGADVAKNSRNNI